MGVCCLKSSLIAGSLSTSVAELSRGGAARPELFATVGAVVVWRHGQETHELTVTVRGAPTGVRDSQRVNGINAQRRFDTHDFFPLQTIVAVELVPAQLPDFSQGINGRVPFWLLQAKQMFLKNRIIQVQPNRRVVGDHPFKPCVMCLPEALLFACQMPFVPWTTPAPEQGQMPLVLHGASARYLE